MKNLKGDIVRYLEKRLGPATPDKDELVFHCPYCLDRTGSESNDPKLWVNPNKGAVWCFRCEKGFKNLEPFFKSLNQGILDAEGAALCAGEHRPTSNLKSSLRASLRPTEAKKEDVATLKPQRLPTSYLPLTKADQGGIARRQGYRYLESRGIPLELAELYHIGYCPTGERAGHLIFPVYQGGQCVYWTTRLTHNVGPKSQNPENKDGFFRRTDCLLNYDNVIGQPIVAVVEGPFDCMAYRDRGVAMLGKVLSDQQCTLIEALVPLGLEELVLSLDPDAAKQQDKIRQRLLHHIPKVTCVYMESGDPHDHREHIDELLATRREPTVADRIRSRFASKK
jgi:DNA primase